MFFVVTIAGLFCGWIGYSLDWIRKRHEMTHEGSLWRWPEWRSTAPGGLWIFGEPGYPEMTIWRAEGTDDISGSIEITRQRFPESEVTVVCQGGASK